VVATSRAVQGLTSASAAAVETADTAEAMACAVIRLLLNPELACERGRESRRLITDEYNWEGSLGRVLQLLENPLGTPIPRLALSPLS
jgi:hypothetical protein